MANTVAESSTVTTGLEAPVKQDPQDPQQAPQTTPAKHKPLTRLYFVRYAKPADSFSIAGLEKEKEVIDSKLRKVGTLLTPLMESRSQLASSLAESRDTATDLKAQIEDVQMFLSPFQAEKKAEIEDRNALKQQRADQRVTERKEREERIRAEQNAKQKKRNEFNSTYGHLGVTNDEEIDAKISSLEYKQQHESLSINDEKLIIKEIQQLQASREPVRQYSEWLAQEKLDREFRTAENKKRKSEPVAQQQANGHAQEQLSSEDEKAKKEREAMSGLKQEIDGLWEKYKLQLDHKKSLQENDKELKTSIDKLIQERDALRKERDELWEKIQKHRTENRAASRPFTQNRNFSSKVRDLVKSGQVEEAQRLCKEQVEETMAQYRTETDFRQEYNQLWDAQVDYRRPLPMYQADSFHSTAASVIAEALETAKRKIANKGSSSQQPPAQNSPNKPNKLKQIPDDSAAEPSEAVAPSKPAVILGMDPISKPKPKKAKKQKISPPVELPVIEQEEFIPPPSARKSEVKQVSEKERKEQEKEHNRLAQAEAAQRKERRRQAQEKKKLQKALKAEQQSKKQSSASEISEEAVGPETPPAREALLENGRGAGLDDAVTEAGAEGSKPKSRVSRLQNKQLTKIAAAPKLRPLQRKKGFSATLRQYARSAYSLAEEKPVVVAGGALAVLAVFVCLPVVYLVS